MRNEAVTILTICAALFAGCARSSVTVANNEDHSSTQAKTTDIEHSIKEKSLREVLKSQAQPLRILRNIQLGTDRGRPVVYPVSLAVSDEGGVYISDNNAHLTHFCSPNSGSLTTLPSHNEQGKLKWPNTIRMWKDSILVSDNDGIKTFKRDGSFQRLLRTYYQINHFTVRQDSTIYANPYFRVQKASNPLIVELNREGALVRGFGIRLNRPSHIGLDDKAYLGATDKYVLATFLHRPTVQVYSVKGRFIREFNVDHPVFKDLIPLSKDEKFVHLSPGRYRLPSYIAGASVVGDRLLVLLDLPRPEIIEFDFQGNEVGRYRDNLFHAAKAYSGFDAQLARDTYQFWVMVANDNDSFALMQYEVSKKQ